MRSRLLLVLVFSVSVSLLRADEATVSNEEPAESTDSKTEAPSESLHNGSPHMNAVVTFVKPPYGLYTGKTELRLPAGKVSSVVASFANIHEGTSLPRFSLNLVEGSLHYPGYYEYTIQNLTKMLLQNTLEPSHEGSIAYHFRPALELANRPFDLAIVVHYHDENGVLYLHTLVNQTVNFYEVEEGIDTELIFLGVLVVAVSIAVLVGIWHWCSSRTVRRGKSQQASKPDDIRGDATTENEYSALIDKKKVKKTERSSNTVTRRQGKR
ncbi:unnamed protein product [Calicophoron daubneyi]|uniref:Translocon-associated protein subunit alpha n=1 Tax=Calicophoron daubneyi TaxID=300641 RepID=A0AAV2TRB2_CALDB